jgi:glutathionylspermidine synthase
MQRERVAPRPDWRARCEAVGFHYHTIDGVYWDESACYRFTAAEIDSLEAATDSLHRLCLQACEAIVAKRRFAELAIPAAFHELVAASWRAREPSVFGRFDLAWTGAGAPKMLEYNADTPTALLESSVVQWQWMQEMKPGCDQFNSIHERLIERWRSLNLGADKLSFACVNDHAEDLGNLEYLRDTAIQAGYTTQQLFIEDIGWQARAKRFVDLADQPIATLCKLYPWEWLIADEFGPQLAARPCRVIEPAWKMMLSNKGILAILWELFPDHENLLPAYREPGRISGDYVRKPLLSREGANISLRRSGNAMISTGSYGAEGYVYQAHTPIACTDGNYAVIGSWIIGDAAAGIGMREDATPITKNTSRFVPHYFV